MSMVVSRVESIAEVYFVQTSTLRQSNSFGKRQLPHFSGPSIRETRSRTASRDKLHPSSTQSRAVRWRTGPLRAGAKWTKMNEVGYFFPENNYGRGFSAKWTRSVIFSPENNYGRGFSAKWTISDFTQKKSFFFLLRIVWFSGRPLKRQVVCSPE